MHNPGKHTSLLGHLKAAFLLLPFIVGSVACNPQQKKGEQMVNLEKVSNDEAAAIRHLDNAIQNNQKDASLYARRATLYLKKGNFNEALQDVEDAITRNKNELAYLVLKAQVLRAKGNPKAALPFALKAERNGHQSTGLYILLSDLYLQLDERQTAETYARKALELGPRNAFALYYNGLVSTASGDTTKAVNHFRKALKEKAGFTEAKRELSNLLIGRGELEEARKLLNSALADKPADGKSWYYKGLLFNELQKSDSALYSYSKAVGIADTLQKAHYEAGKLYYQKGNYEAAITHLKKAPASVFSSEQLVLMLAVAYERTGENIKALEQYQRFGSMQPDNRLAQQGVARTKSKLTMPAVVNANDTIR